MSRTYDVPEVRQSIPGRSRPYRLYTVDHIEFDTLYGQHPIVVTEGWGCSYSNVAGESEWELRVYRVPVGEDYDQHPLYRTRYLSEVAAKRAAFEAGITAFMVYVPTQEA